MVPWCFWGESLFVSFYLAAILRYCLGLNATWLVNSAAHMWGMRPYDKRINPAENMMVALSAVGEGFHNYHHTFPQDYATSEFGWKINLTTFFIDTMAYLGQAYDRRKIPADVIKARKLRTGEGSPWLKTNEIDCWVLVGVDTQAATMVEIHLYYVKIKVHY